MDVDDMTYREHLLGLAAPEPRFATVFRGYDRDEVDSWLEGHDPLASERQREETETLVAETSRRAQALESRLSELQLDEGHQLPDSLVAFVLDRAREVARELPQRRLREAERYSASLRQRTADNLEEARALSARMVVAARRDRDEAEVSVGEARQQVADLRQHASDGARELVHRRWEATTGALIEIELELAGVRARHQTLVAELAQLERSLDESRAQLHEREATELEVATEHQPAATPAVPQPRRSWLIPTEW